VRVRTDRDCGARDVDKCRETGAFAPLVSRLHCEDK
jgi:hypothetical protein